MVLPLVVVPLLAGCGSGSDSGPAPESPSTSVRTHHSPEPSKRTHHTHDPGAGDSGVLK